MTDLMAKDLDLALAYAAGAGVPAGHHGHRPPGAHRGHDGRVRARGLLGGGQGRLRPVRAAGRVTRRPARCRTPGARCWPPTTGPAAVMTIERYADYLGALAEALPSLRRHPGHRPAARPTWPRPAHLRPEQRTYLSINRTGLAGSAFELDDRLVASVARAAADGWTGIKHMTRIDLHDPLDGGRARAARPGAGGAHASPGSRR